MSHDPAAAMDPRELSQTICLEEGVERGEEEAEGEGEGEEEKKKSSPRKRRRIFTPVKG